MVFDLVSNKLQLLLSLNCMRMLDTCHLRMHKKITAINSHHVLAPSTFFLAHTVSGSSLHGGRSYGAITSRRICQATS